MTPRCPIWPARTNPDHVSSFPNVGHPENSAIFILLYSPFAKKKNNAFNDV